MINTIYCTICNQSNITTLESSINLFYCCTMCRENNKNRFIKNNKFNKNKVIDYNS